MSGGGGSKSTTQTTKTEPWGGVQDDLRQAYNQTAYLYGDPTFNKKGEITAMSMGQGPQYYPGQTIVNPNGLENIGQEMQLGNMGTANWLSGMAGGGLQGMLGSLGQTQGGLGAAYQGMGDLQGFAGGGVIGEGGHVGMDAARQLLSAGDPSSNQYFQSALSSAMRPVTEQFQEQVLPGIRRGAVGAGQAGGSRQGIAEGLASRGYMDTMGDIASNMGNQAYAQGLQAMQAGGSLASGLLGQGLGAAGQAAQLGQGLYGQGLESAARGVALAPQTQQMGFMPGQVAEGIGQQRTADQQAQTDADMARWNYQQNLPYTQMADYLALLQGAPGGSTSGAMTSPQTGSLLGRVGGSALAGYGMAGAPGAFAGGLLGLF